MELTDNIKQALMEKKPGLSEKTIQRYINDTQRIYKQVFGKDLNKEKNFKWIRSIDQIEKYFDEKNRSISTRNTLYASIIEVLRAIDHPDKKGLEDLIQQRQKYGDEYNSIEDGLKSKKQEDSCGVKYHELLLGKPMYDIFVDDRAINNKEWYKISG